MNVEEKMKKLDQATNLLQEVKNMKRIFLICCPKCYKLSRIYRITDRHDYEINTMLSPYEKFTLDPITETNGPDEIQLDCGCRFGGYINECIIEINLDNENVIHFPKWYDDTVFTRKTEIYPMIIKEIKRSDLL
jgi:hypothetical protein